MEVTGDTLISFMVEDAFYTPAYPPFETAYLPLLIDKLSQGNMDLLYPWAKELVKKWGGEGFSWGLYFTINCQDDASSFDPGRIDAQIAAYPALDGYLRHREELAVCATWGLDPAPPLATEPVTSDIPTLVLGGTYDPITPPEWSRTAIVNMSNSAFVEFPSSGHSVLTNNPCAMNLLNSFLNNPEVKPNTDCLADTPKTQFILPGEVIIAPAMYEIHYGEIGYSMLEETFFLASFYAIVGIGVIFLITILVKVMRRNNQPRPDGLTRIALCLPIILAISTLFWGLALRTGLRATAHATPTMLRFGLPASAWWFFGIALFIGLMTLIMIGISVLAWKWSTWSIIGRIAISLTTLAAITFCGVLANWGIFTALLVFMPLK